MAIDPTVSLATTEVSPGRQMVLNAQTIADFEAVRLAHPTLRVEYDRGTIWMTPAPVPYHQILVENIIWLLHQTIRPQKLGRLLPSPIDVELMPDQRILQPDLVFIRRNRTDILIGDRRILGAPDLIIEIISPTTAHADRHVKLPIYAESGVPEYWIVDPENTTVELYLLDGTSYRVAGIYTAGSTLDLGMFAAATISVDAIFATE